MKLDLFSLWIGTAAVALGAPFDVRSYGANGSDDALDTSAIQAAIDAAAAAGGGTVEFPAGRYLSYSLQLRSHVTLRLDNGAVLEAAIPSADLSVGYDAPEPNPTVEFYQDFGHSHWHNSLIWGENLEHVGIVGPGMIFGRGLSRGDVGNRARYDLTPAEKKSGCTFETDIPQRQWDEIAALKSGPFGFPGRDNLPAGVGNKAIALKNCRNVIFRDFTIFHGGHFAILATGVDNWTCENLVIDTNRDGIDIDACQNVRIANCTVNSPNDDGICPKSSYGLGYPRMTENLTITNCQVSGYDEGSLLDGTRTRNDAYVFGHGPTGRIKFGTESNGGFRNITISNCVFEYCRGLALESVDGALMEDITITNLTMRDIVNAPIFIRLGARLRGPEGTTVGTAQRIKISNVVASNVANEGGILLAGVPGHPLRDISLSNIFISYQGGGTDEDAARVVPENEKAYPEPWRFGRLNSWGLFARHLENCYIDAVEFRTARDDRRPAVYLESAKDVVFHHVEIPAAPGVPRISVRDVSGLVVAGTRGLADIHESKTVDQRQW